jgi:hypothetical protein
LVLRGRFLDPRLERRVHLLEPAAVFASLPGWALLSVV